MRFIKGLGKFIVFILIVFGVINLLPVSKVVEDNPWMKVDKTLISAHRGGAKLNPENTKKAFDYVIKETNYCDIVEIDIRTTKDNILVINHDSTINRVALEDNQEDINIGNSTFEELKQYNLGRNFVDRDKNKPYLDLTLEEAKNEGLIMMSLEEFFIEYQEVRDFKLFLEIKEDGDLANKTADKVMEYLNSDKYSWWKSRTMIISFTDSVLDYIAEKYPEQYLGALGYKIAPEIAFEILKLNPLYKPKFQCFQTPMVNNLGPISINMATEKYVKMAHKRNQTITYWTINNEKDMQKIIDIGADIITTDAPDVLEKLLNK